MKFPTLYLDLPKLPDVNKLSNSKILSAKVAVVKGSRPAKPTIDVPGVKMKQKAKVVK